MGRLAPNDEQMSVLSVSLKYAPQVKVKAQIWATKKVTCCVETPSPTMGFDFGGGDYLLPRHISRVEK